MEMNLEKSGLEDSNERKGMISLASLMPGLDAARLRAAPRDPETDPAMLYAHADG